MEQRWCWRKGIALILSFLMVLGSLPMQSSAALVWAEESDGEDGLYVSEQELNNDEQFPKVEDEVDRNSVVTQEEDVLVPDLLDYSCEDTSMESDIEQDSDLYGITIEDNTIEDGKNVGSQEILDYSDESISVSEVENAIDDEEVIVGATNQWTVGDGVTAKIVKESGKSVLYFDSKGGTLWKNWRSKVGNTVADVNIIKFTDGTTKMFLPEDSSELFCGNGYSGYEECALESVEQLNLGKVDTSKVKNMQGMFYCCWHLEKLDLRSFDTSNVTNMESMFAGCGSLKDLDVNSFDTSKVKLMTSMFRSCGMEYLNLSNFNTINVTDMEEMFSSCMKLKDLDLSSFDTSNVTSMNSMFRFCLALPAIDLSSFNTSHVTDMSNMFSMGSVAVSPKNSCLTELDLSSFDTSNVTDMSRMFHGCCNLKRLNVRNFNTVNVTSMFGMFEYCSSLTELDLSSFDTSNVTDMSGMFSMSSIFYDIEGGNLVELDLSGFDTSKVENMNGMFYGCSNLKNLVIQNFNTSNVVNMGGMFSGCGNLTSLDVSGFDTSKVEYMQNIFEDCKSITYLDLSSFDMTNVTSSYEGNKTISMFEGCSGLRKVKTPKRNNCTVELPTIMYDELGQEYSELPFLSKSITILKEMIINISECTVTVSPKSYTYNGKAKKPTVTVKDGETVLEQGVDYEVRYENNKKAGTASAKVTGIGKYEGQSTATFTIKKAASKLTFANESVQKTALDEAFTNELIKTTDGTITFISSDEGVASADHDSGLVTIKGIGTATITANATEGENYKSGTASYQLTVIAASIESASVGGVSLSYGYSGKEYTPELTLIVNGMTLAKDTDYSVKYENNKNPGTAKITITGKGKFTGTRIKTFEIVDCVSSIVSGKTYQLIPKNNSKTTVCSYSGKMVNNTKVYITDRSSSEAMKLKAIKNSDGTWKFINAKCELALAVQQNSSEVGKGLVLYDQTTKKAQNWKLSKKSDNSFAIMNAVTGYSIAMSDASAVKGTTLSMAETASSGLQRFYIAETTAVSAPFDGTYGVKAAKDKKFALNIASSSKSDGANVNLYSYSNVNAKKFKIMYCGGGYYRLVNVNSGMCLTVKGNAKTDGANVVQSSWSAADGQRWKITKNSDGTVTMKNALGTVLHLSENKTANGTNVMARKSSSTKAQRWYLE